MEKEFSKNELTSALYRAVGLLARREHSAEELLTKLVQKGFEANIAQGVISRLKSENLQSDERFTESFVNERMGRGHGPIKIQHELARKGVSGSLIETYINPQDDEWIKIAQIQYQKKYANKEVSNYNEWAKRARFLQGRGFTTSQIRALLIFASDVD